MRFRLEFFKKTEMNRETISLSQSTLKSLRTVIIGSEGFILKDLNLDKILKFRTEIMYSLDNQLKNEISQ